MKESIKNKCDLFLRNKETIKKEFKWEHDLMSISAAMVYSGAGKEADVNRIEECRKILEKNTGIFSSLRSELKPVLACKMALASDPMQYFQDVKSVYEKLTKGSFSDSRYLVQAAISICDAGRVAAADDLIAKYKELFKKMSKEHPMITDSGDIVFAMLLTLTSKSVDMIVSEMETCYDYMKKELRIKVSGNEIQGLAEVLALTDGDMEAKCNKVADLYHTFANHGTKYGKDYGEFASLGALIDVEANSDALVDEVLEVADYLKSFKGFGSLSMNQQRRVMFAAMLVADSYETNRTLLSSSTINSTVAAVIAEQVAIMVCIIAATTAATSN
ncbi:MAG: DUF4003 domain-containing protein [Lachnospiraceae bacterium]|nr:DUF4003 domain-containing protein [Lachnospiraceae bacterium]